MTHDDMGGMAGFDWQGARLNSAEAEIRRLRAECDRLREAYNILFDASKKLAAERDAARRAALEVAIREIRDLHCAQTTNNQNYSGQFHEALEMAEEAIRALIEVGKP